MASIGSQGPVSAASPARWPNAEVQDTELMSRVMTAWTTSGGNDANPSRHPVMANVLENPSSRIVRSSIPGTLAIDRCSPP